MLQLIQGLYNNNRAESNWSNILCQNFTTNILHQYKGGEHFTTDQNILSQHLEQRTCYTTDVNTLHQRFTADPSFLHQHLEQGTCYNWSKYPAMLEDGKAIRHMHLGKKQVRVGVGGLGGVVTHFQDRSALPGLTETVPALPAGHLGRGDAQRGNQRGKNVTCARKGQVSSQTLRNPKCKFKGYKGMLENTQLKTFLKKKHPKTWKWNGRSWGWEKAGKEGWPMVRKRYTFFNTADWIIKLTHCGKTHRHKGQFVRGHVGKQADSHVSLFTS